MPAKRRSTYKYGIVLSAALAAVAFSAQLIAKDSTDEGMVESKGLAEAVAPPYSAVTVLLRSVMADGNAGTSPSDFLGELSAVLALDLSASRIESTGAVVLRFAYPLSAQEARQIVGSL